MVLYISPAGRTNLLDISCFKKGKEFLGEEFSKVSALLLTRCDEFDEQHIERSMK